MTRVAALAVWVVAGLSIVLVSNDPVVRVVVLAGAWTLAVRSRLPGRRLRPLAAGLAVLGVVTVVANGLLSHTGATVLVVVPGWLPLVGGPVTVEAFGYGVDVALGLVAAFSIAVLLSLLIDPADLVDALPRVLAGTGAAVGAALNLIPAVAASFVEVRDAQRLRGWRPRGVRTAADLVVPVLLSSIERSQRLAESMAARGYGSGPRTRLAGGGRRAGNVLVAALAVAALVAFLTVRVAGQAGAWYPYPTMSVPSVTPATVGPAVLLGLAGLALPRRQG